MARKVRKINPVEQFFLDAATFFTAFLATIGIGAVPLMLFFYFLGWRVF
jgi:hypothetical protein